MMAATSARQSLSLVPGLRRDPGEQPADLISGIQTRPRGLIPVKLACLLKQRVQDCVAAGVHSYGGRRGILPVAVVPEVRQQGSDCLVHGKCVADLSSSGDVLRHQVLAQGTVHKLAGGLIGVEVRQVTGRGNVAYGSLPAGAEWRGRRGYIVVPLPEPGDRIVVRPPPGPVLQSCPASRHVLQVDGSLPPRAAEHAVYDCVVQIVPEVRERLLAAQDAVEGEDQRHGRCLL
jgi:hypothetical protein